MYKSRAESLKSCTILAFLAFLCHFHPAGQFLSLFSLFLSKNSQIMLGRPNPHNFGQFSFMHFFSCCHFWAFFLQFWAVFAFLGIVAYFFGSALLRTYVQFQNVQGKVHRARASPFFLTVHHHQHHHIASSSLSQCIIIIITVHQNHHHHSASSLSSSQCIIIIIITVHHHLRSMESWDCHVLKSLNHQLFKDIAHVGHFRHFVIGCICLFVNLYLCICIFDSPEYKFYVLGSKAFQKYSIIRFFIKFFGMVALT